MKCPGGEFLDLGLPPEVRLRKRPEILRVQNESRRFTGARLVLLAAIRGPGPSRFGVITSRKVGTAVVRNRVRRRIREILRVRRPFLVDGSDLLIIARSSAAAAPSRQLETDLLRLLCKAGVMGTDGMEGGKR